MYSVDDDLDDDSFDIIRVPSRSVPFDPEDRLMNRRFINQRVEDLASRGFDIVHIQTPFVAHYAGVMLAHQLDVPVVETYHTYFEEYLYHYLRFLPRRWLRWAARRFSRAQSKNLDAMAVPSSLMENVLEAYRVECPLRVIPTGLDSSRFEGGDGPRFRAGHGIEPGRPVLCHVGRSAHEKNIDFLLDMLVLVKQQVPDVLLVLAGEGPARRHLEHMADSLGLGANTLFVDYLDRNSELKDCYQAGDVFVFASRTETQGLVLLEAMAQGVPVVSTAVLGTVDILKHGQGALVANDCLEDFSAKVITLLKDRGMHICKSFEAVGYAHTWSSETMTTRLLGFYSDVLCPRTGESLSLEQVSDSL
jgi:glycosyltransferase involved in cell wall biosynthesis